MSCLRALSRAPLHAAPADGCKPTRGTSEHPGVRSCQGLAPSPRWEGFGMWLWTQLVSQLMPQTCRHVTPRSGTQGNTPPVSSTLPFAPPSSFPRGRGGRFPRTFHSCPCLPPPRDHQPSALAQAPTHPAQGGCHQGSLATPRLHSGTTHWLDTDVNPEGRANSGHPQRDSSGLGRTLLGNLTWVLPSTGGLLGPSIPIPIDLSVSAFHVPQCLCKDPCKSILAQKGPHPMEIRQVDPGARRLSQTSRV